MIKCNSPPKSQADACTAIIYNENKYFYNTYSDLDYCLACIEELLIDKGEKFDGLLELQTIAAQYNYELLLYLSLFDTLEQEVNKDE